MSEEDTFVQSATQRHAARRRGRAFLSVLSGREVGALFKLGPGESIIGRGNDCDVQLVDDGVSRRHAKLVRDLDGTSKIIDLKSTNGTFVNGRRVAVEVLREGDRIRIGQSATLDFQYEYQDSMDGTDGDDAEAAFAGARSTRKARMGDLDSGEDKYSSGQDHVAALKALRKTLRIREETFGPSHPAVAATLDSMAVVLRGHGDHAAALQHHRRALEIYEQRVGDGPEPPEMAHLLTSLGETQLAGGDAEAALVTFERALVMLERRKADDSELAGVRFAVARALALAGREPLRARTLAQLAKEGFGEVSGAKARIVEVEKWLEQRR
jgi:tetratricopeptide (TPR) repeat protein